MGGLRVDVSIDANDTYKSNSIAALGIQSVEACMQAGALQLDPTKTTSAPWDCQRRSSNLEMLLDLFAYIKSIGVSRTFKPLEGIAPTRDHSKPGFAPKRKGIE